MCDILRGNGFLAEPTSHPSANDVEVIFCNPDLLWKNEWEGPRLGQGGFRKAWEGVWSVCHVGSPPPIVRANLFRQHVKMDQKDPVITQFGKPTKETYHFATRVLQEVSDEFDVKLRVGSSGGVEKLGRLSNMCVRLIPPLIHADGLTVT